MARLQFTMRRGGILTAAIFTDRVPATWKAIQGILPLTATTLNARWSGREIFNPLVIPQKPPRENQTQHASLGDVIYACERSDDRQFTGFEAIGVFYGAESINDWRGPFAVNWIGRVDPSQWELLERIGERVYREGAEQCDILAIDD